MIKPLIQFSAFLAFSKTIIFVRFFAEFCCEFRSWTFLNHCKWITCFDGLNQSHSMFSAFFSDHKPGLLWSPQCKIVMWHEIHSLCSIIIHAFFWKWWSDLNTWSGTFCFSIPRFIKWKINIVYSRTGQYGHLFLFYFSMHFLSRDDDNRRRVN